MKYVSFASKAIHITFSSPFDLIYLINILLFVIFFPHPITQSRNTWAIEKMDYINEIKVDMYYFYRFYYKAKKLSMENF